MELLGQVERELHIVLSMSEDMLGGNSRKQLGRRDQCRKRKIWGDWKKCSVISSGDRDGGEYAQTFLHSVSHVPHGFLTYSQTFKFYVLD